MTLPVPVSRLLPDSQPQTMPENKVSEPGWWVYVADVWTLAPWAFMHFFDAIDAPNATEEVQFVLQQSFVVGLGYIRVLGGQLLWHRVGHYAHRSSAKRLVLEARPSRLALLPRPRVSGKTPVRATYSQSHS